MPPEINIWLYFVFNTVLKSQPLARQPRPLSSKYCHLYLTIHIFLWYTNIPDLIKISACYCLRSQTGSRYNLDSPFNNIPIHYLSLKWAVHSNGDWNELTNSRNVRVPLNMEWKKKQWHFQAIWKKYRT